MRTSITVRNFLWVFVLCVFADFTALSQGLTSAAVNGIVLDKAGHNNLNQKKRVFELQTQINKLIFIVVISAQGLKPNLYSENLTHAVVVLEDLFK